MSEFKYTEELVIGLYDRGALKFNDFEYVLASGRLSPIYYNQRRITSFKKGLTVNDREISVERQKKLSNLGVLALSEGVDKLIAPHNHLHGIPQASTVIGGMVAQQRGESYIWQRVGNKKKHGIAANFEADYNEGDAVGVIDDVVTDGASKIRTIDGLREEQLTPAGIVTMMDREEGGAANLETAGVQFIPVLGMSQAVQILRYAGRIGSQEIDWVAQYHEGLRADGLETTFTDSL